MTRRVLIITPHFPPDSSAASHRIRLLAPHLGAYGWTPTVLTLEPGAYEGTLDPDLLQLVPPGLDVVRVPAWPVRATRRFGIGDLGIRGWTALRAGARRLLETGTYQALLITTYPIYPALLGPGLRRRYRVPFVLDLQDPWVGAWGRDVGGGPGGRPDVRSRLARRLAVLLERTVVPAADALTAVSERTLTDVLERVPRAVPRARAELPLGFEPADLDIVRRHPRPLAQFDPSDGLTHLVYVGTVLPTGIDVVRLLLAGLAHLTRAQPDTAASIRLHFVGSSNQRLPGQAHRVLPLAREYGVDGLVREYPERVDYLDALNLQIQAAGVLLLGSTEPHYTPSKAYPALLSGRPLLALYHEQSSVVALLRSRPGAEVLVFGNRVDPEARAIATADALTRLVSRARGPAVAFTPGDAEPWGAPAIARRLADVFDAVSGGRQG